MEERRSRLPSWLEPVLRHAAAGKLIVGALVVAIPIGLSALAWQASRQGEYLFGGRAVPPGELARMETIWAKQGLSGHRREGDRVRIPAGQEARFLAALADSDTLPKDLHAELLKLSTDINPFLSSSARTESLRLAKQNMLAKIIEEMRGIQSAWVLLDSGKGVGLTAQETLTASVSVQGEDRSPLPPERLQQIRRLVASAVAGLSPLRVEVTDLNQTSAPQDEADAWDDPVLRRLSGYRRWYRKLIQDLLVDLPGTTVLVQVMPDVGPHRFDEPANPPARSLRPDAPANAGGDFLRDGGGRMNPFLASLTGATLPAEPAHGSAPVDWCPHRVAAQVRIPDRLLLARWREQLPPDERRRSAVPTQDVWEKHVAAECEELRGAVLALLPGGPQHAAIRVESFALPEPIVPETPAPVPPAAAAGDSLPPHLRDGLIGAGAVVGLWLLVSILFRPWWAPAAALEPTPAAAEGWATATDRDDWSDAALRERVKAEVRRDPQGAAELVKAWLATPVAGERSA